MNQTSSNTKTSKWMTASACVCISVLIHLALALMICLRVIFFSNEADEVKKELAQIEERVIQIQLTPVKARPKLVPPKNAPLTPDELKALAAATPPLQKPEKTPEPKLKPKPKDLPKFQRTSDDQLAGKAPETNIQGERDTIEASNADAIASAQNRPSVRGEKPKDGIEETVDTTFQDGVLEHMNRVAEEQKAQQEKLAELQPENKKLADFDQVELKSSVESTKEIGEELDPGKLATSNKEAKEFLETEKKMALNDDLPSSKNTGEKEKSGQDEANKTIANNQLDPDALKQKPQEEQKKKVESQPKTAENKKASEAGDKGFRSEAKATVMEGTISRRSKIASNNVKATPVGKYMAQISKLVEQEWQRRCMMHADLIQPGTLRIGFMVDENGKVRNTVTISQTMGSETQRSLTFQALTSVKIPPMPKEVKESQGGDPLEFRYYFRFQ